MAASAFRSVLRSSSLCPAAAKIASKSRAAPFRSFSLPKPIVAPRILRSPVELSFCVESLQPRHSMTASALMTSMLAVTRGGYGWLAEGFPLSDS